MYFNQNFMLAALLVVVLFAGVTMGCCQVPEKFENATPMKKTLEDALKEEIDKSAEKEVEKEDEKQLAEAKKAIAATNEETPAKPATAPLNKQEQELFEQITKNSLSNTDLKKLISAGILTENMVEKFLNKIDEGHSEEKIEGFCSGGNCYASIH